MTSGDYFTTNIVSFCSTAMTSFHDLRRSQSTTSLSGLLQAGLTSFPTFLSTTTTSSSSSSSSSSLISSSSKTSKRRVSDPAACGFALENLAVGPGNNLTPPAPPATAPLSLEFENAQLNMSSTDLVQAERAIYQAVSMRTPTACATMELLPLVAHTISTTSTTATATNNNNINQNLVLFSQTNRHNLDDDEGVAVDVSFTSLIHVPNDDDIQMRDHHHHHHLVQQQQQRPSTRFRPCSLASIPEHLHSMHGNLIDLEEPSNFVNSSFNDDHVAAAASAADADDEDHHQLLDESSPLIDWVTT